MGRCATGVIEHHVHCLIVELSFCNHFISGISFIAHQHLRRSHLGNPYFFWSVILQIIVRNFLLSRCLIDLQVLLPICKLLKGILGLEQIWFMSYKHWAHPESSSTFFSKHCKARSSQLKLKEIYYGPSMDTHFSKSTQCPNCCSVDVN